MRFPDGDGYGLALALALALHRGSGIGCACSVLDCWCRVRCVRGTPLFSMAPPRAGRNFGCGGLIRMLVLEVVLVVTLLGLLLARLAVGEWPVTIRRARPGGKKCRPLGAVRISNASTGKPFR